ncbi:hypothetical protein PSJM300_07440 [Stutzerimonas stutzeri DSM 10701]|nr:hypothetical protein PSJM300_07440 [Stutzerimonas stutzeri DSM 10701]
MNIVLDYLKNRYEEEQARFDHFENKCAKIITFITIIIAAITAIAGINKGAIFHPINEIEWLVLISFLVGSFSVSCAWGHSLLALRISEYPTLPRNRATAEYLTVVEDKLKHEHLLNCYTGTLAELSDAINAKCKNLELAYQELTISAWALAVAATLKIFLEITT